MNIVKKVLVGIVAAIAVCMMIFTIISVAVFDRTDRTLFGYRAFIVLSDSMSATDFNAGDLIISKTVDPTTLQEGDIITYVSQNDDNFGEVVTHKIRTLTVDSYGNPGFITYGTTTNTDDEGVVTYPYILGKYIGKVPGVGKFFSFLKTVPGYLLCILVPFMILIVIEGIRVFSLFKRYKKEQQNAIDEERKQLEKEREENQKMMQELLSMKQQLLNGNGGQGTRRTNYAPMYDDEVPVDYFDEDMLNDNIMDEAYRQNDPMDGFNDELQMPYDEQEAAMNQQAPQYRQAGMSQQAPQYRQDAMNQQAPQYRQDAMNQQAPQYRQDAMNQQASQYRQPSMNQGSVQQRPRTTQGQPYITPEMQQRIRESQQQRMQQLTPEMQQRMRQAQQQRMQQLTPEQQQRMRQGQQRMTPEMQQKMRQMQQQRAQQVREAQDARQLNYDYESERHFEANEKETINIDDIL